MSAIYSGRVYLFRKTSTFLGKNQLNVSTAGRKRHLGCHSNLSTKSTLSTINFINFINFRLHCSSKEGCVAEDVERVFGGGHEQGLALAHLDAVDVGFTPQADHHDERVAMEVDLLRYLHDYAMHDEVGAVDELRDGTGAVVGCPVLGPHLVVDGLLCLLDVEFSRVAVLVLN